MYKAMTTDFTWAKSAKYYEGLYLGMLMHCCETGLLELTFKHNG